MDDRARTLLRRVHVGFVFQSYNLVPTLDVRENVLLPFELAGRRLSAEEGAWVDHLIDVLGLADRVDHRPGELSGGQQQRVAIARALAPRPAVVLADEPTGNLDTRSSREVLGLLRTAAREYGQTIVMVSHDPVAASYADRVLVLADGRLVGDHEAMSPQQIAELLIGFEAGVGMSTRSDLVLGARRELGTIALVAAMCGFYAGALLVASDILRVNSEQVGDVTAIGVVLGVVASVFIAVAVYVSAVVIVNGVDTVIAGRLRQIALLRLLGADARSLRRAVVRGTTTVAAVGVTAGVLLGVLTGDITRAVLVSVDRLPEGDYSLFPVLAAPAAVVVTHRGGGCRLGRFACGAARHPGAGAVRCLGAVAGDAAREPVPAAGHGPSHRRPAPSSSPPRPPWASPGPPSASCWPHSGRCSPAPACWSAPGSSCPDWSRRPACCSARTRRARWRRATRSGTPGAPPARPWGSSSG